MNLSNCVTPCPEHRGFHCLYIIWNPSKLSAICRLTHAKAFSSGNGGTIITCKIYEVETFQSVFGGITGQIMEPKATYSRMFPRDFLHISKLCVLGKFSHRKWKLLVIYYR